MQYIVGDLHANIGALDQLLGQLHLQKDDRLIFVGDYIDKLPHTKETLERLMSLRQAYDCVFLKGNHEFVWHQYLVEERPERQLFILDYGGREALRDYGPAAERALMKNDFQTLRGFLQPYIDLMAVMQDWVIAGDYLALHAGLLPDQYGKKELHFEEANYFIRPHAMHMGEKYLGKYTLVGGHTHMAEIPTVEPGYINIDLGAGFDRFLGALCVEKGVVIRNDGRYYPLESS